MDTLNNIQNSYMNFDNTTNDEVKKRNLDQQSIIQSTFIILKSDIKKMKDYTGNDDSQGSTNADTIKKLGEGFFGRVKISVYKDEMIATKTQLPTYHYFNELKVNARMDSKYIVKYYGSIKEKYKLVFELMGGGTLEKFLVNHSKYLDLHPSLRLKIIMKVAKGMDYLHNKCTPPITHGDLSSSNILLKYDHEPDKKNQFKISDFGLSRIKNDAHPFNAKTANLIYLAPEIYLDRFISLQINEMTDVYSFGVLMWEILASKSTVPIGCTPLAWIEKVAYQDVKLNLNCFPKEWYELTQIISKCTDLVPANRLTFKAIIHQLKLIKSNFK